MTAAVRPAKMPALQWICWFNLGPVLTRHGCSYIVAVGLDAALQATAVAFGNCTPCRTHCSTRHRIDRGHRRKGAEKSSDNRSNADIVSSGGNSGPDALTIDTQLAVLQPSVCTVSRNGTAAAHVLATVLKTSFRPSLINWSWR
jgi:hypothetical protein